MLQPYQLSGDVTGGALPPCNPVRAAYDLPPVSLHARALDPDRRPYVLRLRFGRFFNHLAPIPWSFIPAPTRPTPAQQQRTLCQYACTWILSGSAYVTLPGLKPFLVQAGECFQIHGVNPKDYRVDWQGPGAECGINLDGLTGRRLVDLGLWDTSWIHTGIVPNRDLLERFRQLFAYSKDDSVDGNTVLRHMLSWYGDLHLCRQGTVNTFRQHACRLLSEQPGDPPAISAVASSLGLSEPGFRRKFQQVVGVSPHEYQTSVRMRLATELLHRYPIATVSRLVGFSEPASFSRCFRRVYGRSPSSMRG